MSAIHVLDHKTDKILETLSFSKIWDDNHRETLQGEEIFDFTTFLDGRASEKLTGKNRVIIPVEDGFFREFIITRTERYNQYLSVYTVASYLEINNDEPLSPATLVGQTVNTALDYILQGTDWKRGITEGLNTRTIVFEEPIGRYNALKKISNVDTFDLELRFRIETNGNKVTRYVDMIEQQGEWRGREIVSGKDLIGIERREKTDAIVTALYGVGPEQEDGTRDIVQVTDEDARKAWGRKGKHLWGIYTPQSTDQFMTRERLTTLTETELKKRISSAVEYRAEGADLEHILGRSHEKIRLGDKVRIKETRYTPPIFLDSRVIAREGPITDRSRKEYTLGEFIEYTEEDVKALQRLLEKKIARKISEGRLREVAYDKGQVDVIFEDGKSYAELKAQEAQAAAEAYALAEAQLAETRAEAYADGIVSAEEERAIQDAIDKLAEAKADATSKADAAESAANAYTNSQLTNYIDATVYNQEMNDIQAQIDNQIQSHFYAYEPTLDNIPASDWTTDDLKVQHVGDLFYNSETGYSYRFAKEASVYKWILVRDEGIAKALQDASQAQDTADSKRRVFVAQPTTPYDVGDLWDNNGAVYRSTVTKTSGASFSSADWVKIGDVTSRNKSADTDKVGGVPSADIETIAGAQDKATAAEIAAKNYAVAQTLYDAKMDEIASDLADKAGLTYVDGQLVSKADKADTYTISEIDSALVNKVSVTAYDTDMGGVVTRLDDQRTLIAQNETAISLKASQTDLDTVSGDVSSLSGELTVLAGEVALKAESSTVEGLRQDFDNLEVGGRNLLPETRTLSENEQSSNNTANTYEGFIIAEGVYSGSSYDDIFSETTGILDGTEYTVSFYAKSTSPSQSIRCFFYSPNTTIYGESSTGQVSSSPDGGTQVTITDAWQRYWVRWKQSSSGSAKRVIVGRIRSGDAMIAGIKFEKGNKATDWTPAPEDMDVRVTTAEGQITTLAGEIDLKASAVSVDNLETRVSSAEVDIDGLNSEIELRVEKNGVISSINASSESIKLDSARIEFAGAVFGSDATFTGDIEGARITSPMPSGGLALEIEDGLMVLNNGTDFIRTSSNSGLTLGQYYLAAEQLNIMQIFDSGLYGYITSPQGSGLYIGDAGKDIFVRGNIRTPSSESGYCGIGGMDSAGTTSPVAGTGVNFRMRKTYTPSSISLSPISENATVDAISITVDGFWLYANGTGTANTFKYWRGTYLA